MACTKQQANLWASARTEQLTLTQLAEGRGTELGSARRGFSLLLVLLL